MSTIKIMPALSYLLAEHDVPSVIDHTGGGNFVVGIGTCHGYDAEQGTDRYDINLGPVYMDGGSFTGEGGDLYAVSIVPTRDDVTVHVEDQLLPVLLGLLAIEDVNVSDAMIDVQDIAAALGEPWSVGCLGGNTYGVVRDDGTTVTLGDSHPLVFVPSVLTIGRLGPDDDEWQELRTATVWSAQEAADIVTDHAPDYITPHSPECTSCEHDCPWRRTPQPIGAPWCSVCDDHGEAVHAGYGDRPCDCGDSHPA